MRRQCAFLAQLYITGSVASAAEAVGLSRMSAYRLRRRDSAHGFSHAWDHVLTRPGTGHVGKPKSDMRKVTNEELNRRVVSGLVQPVIYRGQVVGVRRKPDNSALLRLIRRNAPLAAWPELHG